MYDVFLKILKAALENKAVSPGELSVEQWEELFSLAEKHKVLPLIYEVVCQHPTVKSGDSPLFARARQRVRHMVLTQTVKTEQFLALNKILQENGIRQLVVKGIVCRELYPRPDHRISSDEDILILPEQEGLCHELLVQQNLWTDQEEEQRKESYEVGYRRKDSPLYIELHKQLFPTETTVLGNMNRFFEGVFSRAIRMEIQGKTVYTLCPTDHLFFLICHAFKHFIHSGFGVRQVCDIVMYANAYGREIDWDRIYQNCCDIHAEVFAAAVFEVGRKHLVFDPEKARYPEYWQEQAVDETDLLKDMLCAGIYGSATMSRVHSSNITLKAVAAGNKGKNRVGSVIRTIFPSVKSLKGRYPYLRKCPWLLPIAWADRILKYGKEISGARDNHAAESLKIGNQRVELLRQYGILR